MSQKIKAGWYPDPTREAAERWWDGSEWTSSVRAAVPASEQAPVAVPGTASSRLPQRAAVLTVLVLLVGGGAAALWLGLGDGRSGERPVVANAPQEGIEGDGDEEVDVEAPGQPQQPADLHSMDWTTVAWTTSCTESGDLEEVRLSPARRDGLGPLSYDAFPDSDTAMQVYSVDRPEAYGDVTGDGRDDAIFITSCFLGNHFVFSVEVWSHDETGATTHLPPVFSFSKLDGAIERVDVVDGNLRVLTHEPVPGDDHPHLNDYPVEVVTDWQFVAQRWMANEASRIHPGEYGSDPHLDGLYDACADGDIDSCRSLYYESPVDSDYEFYGQICGDRTETYCWLSDALDEHEHIVDAFATPTRNIYCAVTTHAVDSLECGIGSLLNPSPGYCEFDWAGLYLPQTGAAEPVCAGDAFLGGASPQELPVLDYGESWTHGEIACRSERSGLECGSRSGGGFTLSRSSWDAW